MQMPAGSLFFEGHFAALPFPYFQLNKRKIQNLEWQETLATLRHLHPHVLPCSPSFILFQKHWLYLCLVLTRLAPSSELCIQQTLYLEYSSSKYLSLSCSHYSSLNETFPFIMGPSPPLIFYPTFLQGVLLLLLYYEALQSCVIPLDTLGDDKQLQTRAQLSLL